MTKTLKQTIAAVAVAAVAGVGGYALFGSDSDKYLNTIPQDVQALLKVDVHAVVKQSKLSTEQVQQLTSRIAPDEGESVTELGIDFTDPIYGFVSINGYFGITASVSDIDALEKSLSQPASGGKMSEVQRQRGYSWTVINGNYLMAYDADKMLVMGPAIGTAQDQLRNEMYHYLQQKADESGKNNPLYDDLKQLDSPIAAVLEMSVVPKPVRQSAAKYLPGAMTEDVRLGLKLDIHEHDMEMSTQFLTENDESLAKLKEFGQRFRPIDGSLLTSADEGAVAWACMNLKGDDILPLLRSVPAVRIALMGFNMVADVDQMLGAIDGDVALQLMAPSGLLAIDRLPLKFNAQLANTDFLKNADYWIRSSRRGSLRALSATDFALSLGGLPLWFGANDRVLYLTNNDALRHSSGNSYLSEHKRDISGYRFFLTIDLTRLDAAAQLPMSLGRLCQHLNLSMKEFGELQMDAEGPQDTNFLYELLKSATDRN